MSTPDNAALFSPDDLIATGKMNVGQFKKIQDILGRMDDETIRAMLDDINLALDPKEPLAESDVDAFKTTKIEGDDKDVVENSITSQDLQGVPETESQVQITDTVFEPKQLPIPIRIALVYCLRCTFSQLRTQGSNEFWKIVSEILIASAAFYVVAAAQLSLSLPDRYNYEYIVRLYIWLSEKTHIEVLKKFANFAAIAILTGCIHGFQTQEDATNRLVLDNEYKTEETFNDFVEKLDALSVGAQKAALKKLKEQRIALGPYLRLSKDPDGRLAIDVFEIPKANNMDITLKDLLTQITIDDKWKYWVFGKALISLGEVKPNPALPNCVLNVVQTLAKVKTGKKDAQLDPSDEEYRTNIFNATKQDGRWKFPPY